MPIFKSGGNKDPSNYRPISVLSVLSKPLEKRHLSYLKTNDLIYTPTSLDLRNTIHAIPHLRH